MTSKNLSESYEKKIEKIKNIFKKKSSADSERRTELYGEINTKIVNIVRNKLLDKKKTLKCLEKAAKEGENYIVLTNTTSFYRHPLRKLDRNDQYEILHRLKDYYDRKGDSYVKKEYGPDFFLEVQDEPGFFWSVFCRLVLKYNPD